MDFFGDYSIASASSHPSSLSYRDQDDSATSNPLLASGPLSPCDTRTSYPIEFANMTNLARAFGLQQLGSTDEDAQRNHDPLSSASLSRDQPSLTHSQPSAAPRTPPCWRRRMQRQRDLHLQSDPSHLRSISELVERMVNEGSQCKTNQRTRQPRPRPSMISVVPSDAFQEEDDNEDDSEFSDLSSPRSLSGSSTNGRSPTYFEPSSPAWRRGNDYISSGVSKDGRIQKSRHRKSPTRERR